jgi:biotin carboxylase
MQLVPYGPDAEADPGSFDADRFVDQATDELARLRVAGVVSSSDYPGCLLAAVIAERLGLPGAPPIAMLRASHKYFARESLLRSVPEATPRFQLLDPDRLFDVRDLLDFPLFVKPVKSWFSQLAQRVDSFEELAGYAGSDRVKHHLRHFVRPLNQLLAHHPEFTHDAGHLLAEEVLVGLQVTVEGYVFDGRTTVLTIVDSDMYAGSGSFERFVLPSNVSADQAADLATICDRAVRGLGFTHGLFNIEFIYEPLTGRASIIEVNPRMCGQFADLTEHVTGVNTYQVLCDLGLGIDPPRPRHRGSAAGASYPFRRFGDATVVSVPGAAEVAKIQRRTAATLIAIYYDVDEKLSDRAKHFDGESYRYACVNVVGTQRSQLDVLARSVEQQLAIELADL